MALLTRYLFHRTSFIGALLAIMPCVLHAQYPNIRISSPEEAPEEVTIAINPTNPLNLIAAANLSYYAYSTDGGWTWQEGHLNSQFGVWGDPCVAFDPSGNAHYAHLSNPQHGYWLDRLVVQGSTDGGATWSDGVPVGANPPTQQDKEWMASDFTTSSGHGNLYMMWTQFDHYASNAPGDSSRGLFARSTDNGLTWSAPIRLADRAGDCLDGDNTVQGAVPAIGPNGEIYTAWSGPLGIMFDKSTDGGISFGVDRFLDTQPGGWDFEIPGLQRCNGFPTTLCDVTSGAHRGYIYVIWSDQRNGADNTDIFFRRSTDGGATWSDRRRVNSDSSRRHQFFPVATLDPTDGDIYVAFYDRRATDGAATDLYVARSSDGGETFDDFKVSDSSFTPNPVYFLGDYIGITAYGGRAYPVWTRMDGDATSTWTAIVGDSAITGVAHERYPGAAEGIVDLRNATSGAAVTIYFSLAEQGEVRLTIHDALGKRVRTLDESAYTPGLHAAWWDGLADDRSALPSGVYFVMMRTPRATYSRKVLLLR